MYFNSFPVIPYDNEGNGNLKDVTNLLRRVAIRSKVSTNTAMFDTYDIKEGDNIVIFAKPHCIHMVEQFFRVSPDYY